MPELITLFKGIAMGIILSVITPPASLWMIQIGFKRNWVQANGAGIGLAAGHAFLTILVGYCLLLLVTFWEYIAIPARILAMLVLLYMGWKCFRAQPMKSVLLPEETRMPSSLLQLVQQTGYVLITMPMRVPVVFAYMVATAVLYRMGGIFGLPVLALGVFLGAMSWNSFLNSLGWAFGRRIDESISLRSLNKLARLAAYVFFILAAITVLPMFVA
mgnify:CR=1 FL=1